MIPELHQAIAGPELPAAILFGFESQTFGFMVQSVSELAQQALMWVACLTALIMVPVLASAWPRGNEIKCWVTVLVLDGLIVAALCEMRQNTALELLAQYQQPQEQTQSATGSESPTPSFDQTPPSSLPSHCPFCDSPQSTTADRNVVSQADHTTPDAQTASSE